jgi:hypothetical protein
LENLKGIYEHYKGMRYELIDVVRHSETLEEMVLYRTLYKNDLGALWVRPFKMFFEDVTINGVQRPRFQKISASVT